jgi:hypothetical protein
VHAHAAGQLEYAMAYAIAQGEIITVGKSR